MNKINGEFHFPTSGYEKMLGAREKSPHDILYVVLQGHLNADAEELKIKLPVHLTNCHPNQFKA